MNLCCIYFHSDDPYASEKQSIHPSLIIRTLYGLIPDKTMKLKAKAQEMIFHPDGLQPINFGNLFIREEGIGALQLHNVSQANAKYSLTCTKPEFKIVNFKLENGVLKPGQKISIEYRLVPDINERNEI